MEQLPRQKRRLPPLDQRRLRDLGLHYAGRYATTKAKLSSYLTRKIRERGWTEGAEPPDLNALIHDFAEAGYVNDAAYAAARARSFVRRGYGKGRLEQDLSAAGISDHEANEARAAINDGAYASAHAFARRKHIGPYAAEMASPELRQKHLAAFIRAGHSFDLARRFVAAAPGDEIEGP